MPMLFGTLEGRNKHTITFAVDNTKGDAKNLGLCGTIEFPTDEVILIEHVHPGVDALSITPEMAARKSRSCQLCD